MFQCNVKEKHIRKDSWVKDIIKTYNPEILAELIKKRIEFPNSTGPFVKLTQDEVATDIIDAFIAEDDIFKEKLTPAIGFLLYKMLHGKMTESHEILRGVFSIIRESKLKECETLVYNWLNQKRDKLDAEDSKWRNTYREGMMAYARIQSKNKSIEDWWFNVWKESTSAWWPPAFLGLRIQNPELAAEELPLLIKRKIDKTPYLLIGMWTEESSRHYLEVAIKKGLDENTGWAGFALNMLLEKLSDSDKTLLMLNLK